MFGGAPLRRLLSLALASGLGLLLTAARAQSETTVDYRIDLSRVAAHLVKVEASFPAGENQLELFLPVWTPGSYLVREYARNLEAVEAFDLETGAPLPCTKSRKNRWLIEAGGRPRVGLRYAIYSRDNSVRGNWADLDFALLNGAQTFVTGCSLTNLPHRVAIALPKSWSRACSALPGDHEAGFLAKNYDELVDSPIVCGNPAITHFEVAGRPHELVTILPPASWNQDRATRDLQNIVQAQMDFWGDLPYQRYVFINIISGGGGGLEHSASTVLMSSEARLANPAGYHSWLGLVSHEFFHTWNGKRLRPKGFGPFDYENERMTRSLWIVEGITDYYAGLILARAGFGNEASMISELERRIAGLKATPGERVQSLSDASFDAWIKYYRPDENSRNTSISYYSKGSIAAWHLDITMRRLSNGRASLDELMRAARLRFPEGYTDADFESLASELTGADLSAFFDAALRRAEALNLFETCRWLGLQLAELQTPGAGLGLELEDRAGRAHLKAVLRGSPAFEAGLQVDDEVLAIDRRRFAINDWLEKRTSLRPGSTVEILIARRGALQSHSATLAPLPPRIQLAPAIPDSSEQEALWRRRQREWITGKPATPSHSPARLY
jgi:predicted metalloprotease with PDZ domain